MKTEKMLTKKRMRPTSVFLTELLHRQWLAAAEQTGLSRSEFLRQALRAKADEILNRAAENRLQ